MNCSICPRACGKERSDTVGQGFCRQGTLPKIARAALHFWEEPCISGEKGSGTIFFSGCVLGCVFCQNHEISGGGFGKVVSEERLAEIMHELVGQGAENINLVSPTPFAETIIRVLEREKERLKVPVVYNTGGYESVKTLKRLEGLVDIYLPDMKYRSAELSLCYSGAEDYPEIAERAILEMCRQTGPAQYDDRGMMLRGTVVRHLILPSHTEESIDVLRWCKEVLPEGTPVSVMAQYTPCGNLENAPELRRRISKREYNAVLDELFELDLDGYVQERSSAKEEYIPPFDLTGI